MRWSLGDLLAGLTARERALELFGLLRVWDTEHNNGVLIYVLHAEHAVEIVADRGARALRAAGRMGCAVSDRRRRSSVPAATREGALAAIDGAAQLLARHFPCRRAGQ